MADIAGKRALITGGAPAKGGLMSQGAHRR
jgi:hypothetical protein